MTALSETEQATLDRIEAAVDAPESLWVRVTVAIAQADSDDGDFPPYDAMADAAIAVMRGQA